METDRPTVGVKDAGDLGQGARCGDGDGPDKLLGIGSIGWGD